MDTETQEAKACPHCAHPALEGVREFRLLRRVTSDCRPWPAGGRLCVCGHCGIVQKIIVAASPRSPRDVCGLRGLSPGGRRRAGRVRAVLGRRSARSLRLLGLLRDAVTLPHQGRMLDIGCGNGATLRAFGRIAPAWSLVGTELDDRCRRQVETLPGVEALYTCPPDQVPGSFDAVTMIHVLEHIPAPGPFLAALLPKMAAGGLLVLELPHYAANPFELLIADHCTHFTAATAAGLLQSVGYDVLVTAEDWIPKELSIVARAGQGTRARGKAPRLRRGVKGREGCQPPATTVAGALAWLAATAAAARQLAARGEIGLLGTSIAAGWLFAELDGAVRFFVDEDPSRVGKTYLDRPVYHPSQVPKGSVVFIPQPAALAAAISRRLARPGVVYHLPPGG